MSVNYLFVGGPSHGKLVEWPEEARTITVPVPIRHSNGFGEYAEDATLPTPRRMYEHAVYVTEEVETWDSKSDTVYSFDVAVLSPLGNDAAKRHLLLDALIRNFPGRRKETSEAMWRRRSGAE